MDVAVGQYGYVTAEDAAAVGVVADRLRKMAERGTLERVAYGLLPSRSDPFGLRGPEDVACGAVKDAAAAVQRLIAQIDAASSA